MDVKAYCSSVREDLTVWKSRIYDLLRDMDRRSAYRENMSSAATRLSALVDSLEQRAASLEASCPPDWGQEKAEMEEIRAELLRLWQEAVETSPDDE